MERTFHSQRSMLQDPGQIFSIHSFLEMYPFLARHDQVGQKLNFTQFYIVYACPLQNHRNTYVQNVTHAYLQIQSEYDRIVADQHTNFLAMKLRWLEVGPKILALAEAERENGYICTLLQQSMEDSDEGWHRHA